MTRILTAAGRLPLTVRHYQSRHKGRDLGILFLILFLILLLGQARLNTEQARINREQARLDHTQARQATEQHQQRCAAIAKAVAIPVPVPYRGNPSRQWIISYDQVERLRGREIGCRLPPWKYIHQPGH